MKVAGGILGEAGGGGEVIHLFVSYLGDRKNIWRDGEGMREGSLESGDSN